MIDLSFTAEQEQFRDSLRQFAAREIAPLADSCDRSGVYPRQLFRTLGELGYLGVG